MSSLFGGNLADDFGEIVRKQKEEFDSIDIDTHFKKNQWKNKTVKKNKHNLQLSKSITPQKRDINAFLADNNDQSEEEEEEDDDEIETKTETETDQNDNNIQYLDVRNQTIFTYSNKPKINKYDKKKNAKKSSLSYIQNNNVRTSFKQNNDNTKYYDDDPFLNQKLIRQRFMIHRTMKNHSMIRDKSRIGKLARNNLQFIKQILITQNTDNIKMKNNLLFNKGKFNRKLRFTIGAPNKRKQRNYELFQRVMKKQQNNFNDKKDLYRIRGLRVADKLDDKVMIHKYGRKKIWNAGRSKKSKRKGTVGGYEIAKSINEW